jgi:hypothetical protein
MIENVHYICKICARVLRDTHSKNQTILMKRMTYFGILIEKERVHSAEITEYLNII